MFELVPSEYMRTYFKEIGFEFTDFQKATLIWNTYEKTWKEKLEMLKILANDTDDKILKNQIGERITIENKKFSKFIDNQLKRHVYVVEDFLGYSIGFFLNYDKAMKYAKKCILKDKEKHRIHKQLIVNSDEDEIITTIEWKINSRGISEIDGESTKEYGGEAVATIHLDLEGNINDIYSDEILKEEEKAIFFKEERFENQFLNIPYEAKAGLHVKDLRDGTYRILADDTESWNNFLRKREEKDLYVDFEDTAITVYQLSKRGIWNHEHINPLYLEVERSLIVEDDEKSKVFCRAMESLSDYLSCKYSERRNNSKGENVVKYAREYAELCKENYWDTVLKEAKIASNILY